MGAEVVAGDMGHCRHPPGLLPSCGGERRQTPLSPVPGLEVAQPLLLLAGRGPRPLQRRPQDVLRLRLYAGHHHQQVSAAPVRAVCPKMSPRKVGCDLPAGLCTQGLEHRGLLGIESL